MIARSVHVGRQMTSGISNITIHMKQTRNVATKAREKDHIVV
jgi:hypothetical protein